MKRPTWDRYSARRELRLHLDYYVESFAVHTCQRLTDVLFLLRTAEEDGAWLLLEWCSEAGQGLDK